MTENGKLLQPAADGLYLRIFNGRSYLPRSGLLEHRRAGDGDGLAAPESARYTEE